MSVFSWRLRGEFYFNRLLFRVPPRQILDVVKSNVNHESDQQHGTACLDRADDASADGLAPNSFDDGEQNVASVEDRDGQHIQQSEINVHQYAEPNSQAPALLTVEQAIIDVHDFNRAAEVLDFY